MPQDIASASESTVLQTIADGLRVRPAYLLIFAIATIFGLFGLGSGVTALVKGSVQLSILAFAAFVISDVVAVVVILRLETPLKPDGLVCQLPTTVGNARFDDILDALKENIAAALRYDNDDFHSAVLEQCNEFRSRSADWGRGTFTTFGHYNDLLLAFYKHARHSVFSTSIPAYLSAWTTRLGEQIIETHVNGAATVTRVFLFDTRDQVDAEAVKVMKNQNDKGIVVMVNFAEDAPHQAPTQIIKDFTIIDHGDAIGVTKSFGANLAAEWYIKDKNKMEFFEDYSSKLKDSSVKFPTFYSSWQSFK